MSLASFFSLSTRAATSATLTPALRLGGSATWRVFTRGAVGHDALFLQSYRVLDGDFVKGVHAQLDVGDIHAVQN